MTTSPVPSITDEQIAEIEGYAVQALTSPAPDAVAAIILSATDINALIARLRAAEKDAERFRWIAENADVDCRGHAPEGDYESLGCRIDAAMTEAKP